MEKKINKILYFVLAIIVFSSLGVVLPLAFDYFKNDSLTSMSLNVIPNNLITYGLAIFFVASIDRIIQFIDDKNYKHKKIEVLIIVLIVLIEITLLYFTFQKLHHSDLTCAGILALCLCLLGYVMWWIANRKDTKTDPLSAIGGKI